MIPIRFARHCLNSSFMFTRTIREYPSDLESVIKQQKPNQTGINTWLWAHNGYVGILKNDIIHSILPDSVDSYVLNPAPYTGASPHGDAIYSSLDNEGVDQWFLEETGAFPSKGNDQYQTSLSFNYNQLLTACNKLRYYNKFLTIGAFSNVGIDRVQTGTRTTYDSNGDIINVSPYQEGGVVAAEKVQVSYDSVNDIYYISETISISSVLTASIKDSAITTEAALIESLFTYMNRDVIEDAVTITTFDSEFYQMIDEDTVEITEIPPNPPLNDVHLYQNIKRTHRNATEYYEMTIQELLVAYGAPI